MKINAKMREKLYKRIVSLKQQRRRKRESWKLRKWKCNDGCADLQEEIKWEIKEEKVSKSCPIR